MTVDELFSAPPLVEPKRQPKSTVVKRSTYVPFDDRREAGDEPEHNFIKWNERSEEQRKKDIKHEINYIMKKMATSVNFKKLHIRSSSDRYYRNTLNKPTKECTKCGKHYSKLMFDKIKDPKKGKDVRRPYCCRCRKKMNAEAYQRRKKCQ